MAGSRRAGSCWAHSGQSSSRPSPNMAGVGAAATHRPTWLEQQPRLFYCVVAYQASHGVTRTPGNGAA
eukprot:11216968-Lingulodinium_polyedra.AAC.1